MYRGQHRHRTEHIGVFIVCSYVNTMIDFTNIIITSPPIGGGRGIVMPMSVCQCFRKISMSNISVISQPIIMKLDMHIEYDFSEF